MAQLLADCCGVDTADLTSIWMPLRRRPASRWRQPNENDGLNIHAERRCVIAPEQSLPPILIDGVRRGGSGGRLRSTSWALRCHPTQS